MKAILMSNKPEWVAKIFNGEKTIEIRKKFPKDYQGWVYIFCTKDSKNILCHYYDGHWFTTKYKNNNWKMYMNGKVVARFWCDKVGEIKRHNAYSLCTIGYHTFVDRFYSDADLQKASCLNGNELMWYLKGEEDNEIVGYAIHISKLEIFDRSRELSEFYCNYTINDYKKGVKTNYIKEPNILMKKLTKAPSNYCYIEGEE